MTLALVQPPEVTPPPPAAAPGWIDLEEAARRSGLRDGYLRRKCADEKRCKDKRGTWQQRGLARLVEQEGARARWLVHESADDRLAPVKSAEARGAEYFDLGRLTAVQRQEVLRREDLVVGYDRAVAIAVAGKFSVLDAGNRYADEVGVSLRALQLWRVEYRARGQAGLIDERWRVAAEAKPKADDPFLLECQRRWLDKRQRSMQLAYDGALEEATAEGWATCSYKTATRYLKSIGKREIAFHRGGEEAYAAATSCPRRDYTTIRSNDLWVGDHHRLDVVCVGKDGKPVRPWLTAWQDMRSRLITGWVIYESDPNADRIAAALVLGMEACGVPRKVLVDNGKDYKSFCLTGLTKKDRLKRDRSTQLDAGIFGRHGISVTHARPYRPQAKPIERFFGTVAGRFSQDQDTYCGRSPQTKPEDLQRQIERHAPTVEELAAAFGAWLDGDYQYEPHRGDGLEGKTPAFVHAANLDKKIVIPEGLKVELRCEWTKPLKVGRNGVQWKGLFYGSNDPRLVKIEGQLVRLGIDHQDLQLARVYDAEGGNLLCVVRPATKIPVNADSQTVRDVVAQERRDRRAAKNYHEVRPRLALSRNDRLHLKAAEKRAAAQASPPDGGGPSLVPLRSPLEASLPAVRAAFEGGSMRAAVGSIEPIASSRFEYAARSLAGDDDDSAAAAPVSFAAFANRVSASEEP